MPRAFYNEIDPYAAEWLRRLIAAGHIADGVVDERSILEVEPADLRGFDQCHFFAGIGVWSHSLRAAGWSDDRPVWTASMPCQPFSAAGKGKSHTDERHLAPVWLRLLEECRPPVAIGEQVGASVGMGWLDALFISLEQVDYACGAVVFPACSVGAPHIRQRLYWVAHAQHARYDRPGGSAPQPDRNEPRERLPDRDRESRVMADTDEAGSSGERSRGLSGNGNASRGDDADRCGESFIVGDADHTGPQGRVERGNGTGELPAGASGVAGATNGFWRDAVWIPCRDRKARPTEPGTFPLAHGSASRVGRLRAYGNAICAPQASEFIRAAMSAIEDRE